MTESIVNKHSVPTWEKQKNNLKARFPELTKNDLNFDEVEKYEMLSKLQLKLG